MRARPRDRLSSSGAPVAARATYSGSPATGTDLPWTAVSDPHGMVSGINIIAPVSGWYRIKGWMGPNSPLTADLYYRMDLRKNGGSFSGNEVQAVHQRGVNAAVGSHSVHPFVFLQKGDYIGARNATDAGAVAAVAYLTLELIARVG